MIEINNFQESPPHIFPPFEATFYICECEGMLSYLQTPQVFPSASNTGNTDTQSDASGDEVIDLKGDQFHETKDISLNLTSWDIWALGLSTTFGGHFYLWSTGLTTGFGGLVVQTFLVFTGYAVLLLCMAELASALPFAGD